MSKVGRFVRRRWVKRTLRAAVVCLVLVAISLWWNRRSTRREGEERLAHAVAALGSTDSRWRWEEIDADLGHMPDDQNAAVLVAEFHERRGKVQTAAVRADNSVVLSGIDANRRLSDADYSLVADVLSRTEAAGPSAIAIRDRPRGLRRVQLAQHIEVTFYEPTHATRHLLNWLNHDAERQSRGGRPGIALSRIWAMLHAGRT